MNLGFESFVNSEECKTQRVVRSDSVMFESFVNSEECKTEIDAHDDALRLRALLIQKSVKQRGFMDINVSV